MPTTPYQWIQSYVCIPLVGTNAPIRTPACFCTYTARSSGNGLFRRRLLPCWVSWDTEQHQEVPVHSSSPCPHGSGVHALQLHGRVPVAQPQHGHSRGQVQPAGLHQRARAALVLPSRRTLAAGRPRTRPISERPTSRTKSPRPYAGDWSSTPSPSTRRAHGRTTD